MIFKFCSISIQMSSWIFVDKPSKPAGLVPKLNLALAGKSSGNDNSADVTTVISPKGMTAIPKLKLKTLVLIFAFFEFWIFIFHLYSQPESVLGGPSKQTRSSRRLSSRGPMKVCLTILSHLLKILKYFFIFNQLTPLHRALMSGAPSTSSAAEMNSLAFKLGETYVTVSIV